MLGGTIARFTRPRQHQGSRGPRIGIDALALVGPNGGNSAAAGSESDVGAYAVGSQLHALVRLRGSEQLSQSKTPHRSDCQMATTGLLPDSRRTDPLSLPLVLVALQIRDELIWEVHRQAIGSRLYDLLH